MKTLKRFGNYYLIDRVGEGGMAEIFRARPFRADLSGKLMIVKRMQESLRAKPEMRHMFRAESDLGLKLNHPNIPQVYDAGETDELSYIAMEWIDGRDLKQIMNRCLERNHPLHLAHILYIAEQVALALHYAHHFKDPLSGQKMNLVHRDVSPQNILIAFDGRIKIIDFGIVKNLNHAESTTKVGVIKGKLSYLSPEQVTGEGVDHRSDIFSLGIVLWELIAGRRLFSAEGDHEFQVLKMIDACESMVTPPSLFRTETPESIDEFIMQCLRRDPHRRFSSAEDVAKNARKLIQKNYNGFSPSDLSTEIKKLFQEHIIEDRKKIHDLNQIAEKEIKHLISLEEEKTKEKNLPPFPVSTLVSESRTTTGGNPSHAPSPSSGSKVRITARDLNLPTGLVVPPPPKIRNSAKKRGFLPSWTLDLGKIAIAASLSVVLGFFAWRWQSDKIQEEGVAREPATPFSDQINSADLQLAVIRLEPELPVDAVTVKINGVPAERRDLKDPPALRVPKKGAIHVEISASGYHPKKITLTETERDLVSGEVKIPARLLPIQAKKVLITGEMKSGISLEGASFRILRLGDRGLVDHGATPKDVYLEQGDYVIEMNVPGFEGTKNFSIINTNEGENQVKVRLDPKN